MQCPLMAGEKSGEAYRQANEALIGLGAGLPVVGNLALQQHLETCTWCKAAVEAQREVWSALDAWTPAPVPSNFDERVYARIDAYQQQSWWRRTLGNLSGKWSWKPAMPVAVACTVLIAAFLLDSPEPKHPPPASVQQLGFQHGLDSGVDVQQVERALDDLDMLKQLGVASTQPASIPLRPRNL